MWPAAKLRTFWSKSRADLFVVLVVAVEQFRIGCVLVGSKLFLLSRYGEKRRI